MCPTSVTSDSDFPLLFFRLFLSGHNIPSSGDIDRSLPSSLFLADSVISWMMWSAAIWSASLTWTALLVLGPWARSNSAAAASASSRSLPLSLSASLTASPGPRWACPGLSEFLERSSVLFSLHSDANAPSLKQDDSFMYLDAVGLHYH